MAKLSCRTGDSPLALWRPRLYFTCHPKDYLKYFDGLCRRISCHRACDIYYNDRPDIGLDAADRKQLRGMNLFVVPVTADLLFEPNDAMDKDIPFAREHHIPILPVLVQPGINPAYSLPQFFGDLPCADVTAAPESYLLPEEQLGILLDSMLVSNTVATLALTVPEGKEATARDSYLSGIALLAGINREVDAAAARKLLEKAARNGDDQATEQLYRMHLHGIGIPKDYSAALRRASRIATGLRSREKLENWPRALQFLCTLPTPLESFEEQLSPLVLLTRLFKLSQKTLGDSHDTTLLYGRLLADLCRTYRKFDRLEDISRRLLRISEEARGKYHIETLACQFRLAIARQFLGDKEEAMKLMLEVYQTLAGEYREDSLLAMSALHHLAELTCEEARYDKALELAKKCYQLRVVNLGSASYDTLRTLTLLGKLQGNMGQQDEVLSKRRLVQTRMRRLFGPKHPETLEAQLLLAMSFNHKKEYAQALRHAEKVYLTYRDFYGADYTRTILTRHIYERIKKNSEEET